MSSNPEASTPLRLKLSYEGNWPEWELAKDSKRASLRSEEEVRGDMPSTKQYGSESAANGKIGGVPKIHYFDFESKGRGQVVRLILIDAGAAFIDVRYTFDEWPKHKREIKNPTGNIPVVEMPDGRILTQSYSIVRHWGRLLGGYDGETEDEKYWADAINDIVVDWRTLFITAFFASNKDETYPAHCSGDRKRFLDAIETHLNGSEISQRGPFVLGEQFSYADMTLYQVLHDEGLTKRSAAGLEGWPRLRKLVEGLEKRERIKKWLESEDYLG